MYSNFLELVKTDYDREVLISEIDKVLATFYQVTKSDDLSALRAETLSLIKKAEQTESNLSGFLKSLRQMLLDLKTFELTISIEPSQELVDEIFLWLKMNVKDPILLKFKKKADLIGGAEVSYKGKYYALTLDKILDQEIVNLRSIKEDEGIFQITLDPQKVNLDSNPLPAETQSNQKL